MTTQKTNTKPVTKKKKKKKKGRLRIDRLLLLILPVVLLIALIGFFGFKFFHPLSLKSEVYTIEYNSGETFDSLDNLKSLYFGSSDNITVTGNVDVNTIGTYPVTYTYKNKDYDFTVEVSDTKGPDLTVKNYSTDTVEELTADDFVESISDASQYSYSLDSSADQKEAGTYNVSVTAVDEHGNETVKTAKLTRTADTQAPVLDDFEETRTMLQGNNVKIMNYAIEDNLDENPSIVADTSQVNTDVPGDYTVTYTTVDRSGNQNVYTQTLTVESNPDYGKNIAYFTFDDGPSENTLPILDILDQYGAKATFFVTGLNPDYYDVMKEIVNRGHTIALHTYSHDYASLYASDEAYFEDLQKISDLVYEETGVVADCIRFPGGSSNEVSKEYNEGIMTRLVQEVQDKGYQYFDWNADSTDASGIGVPAATIIANATSYIGPQNVNILFHDANGKETTVEALPEILEAYQEAGYVFRGVDNEGFAPHHGVNN